MWQYTGKHRPDFADVPGPGQESVWDYPRPPALVDCDSHVQVFDDHGSRIADTGSSLRVLETASPPTYYLPPDAVDWSLLQRIPHRSFCEWKGEASYWALAADPQARPVGWSYHGPSQRFRRIDGCISFYPGKLVCLVDGERVRPQPGDFYGGWVTSRIAGPVKGGPGTNHW
jgi:uncharacterized protein (DUF427 family)